MPACSSCGEPILWATTRLGKRIPLDADPHPEGNVELTTPGGRPVARVIAASKRPYYVRAQEAMGGKVELYRSHFATCPNAATHRNRGAS